MREPCWLGMDIGRGGRASWRFVLVRARLRSLGLGWFSIIGDNGGPFGMRSRVPLRTGCGGAWSGLAFLRRRAGRCAGCSTCDMPDAPAALGRRC